MRSPRGQRVIIWALAFALASFDKLPPALRRGVNAKYVMDDIDREDLEAVLLDGFIVDGSAQLDEILVEAAIERRLATAEALARDRALP